MDRFMAGWRGTGQLEPWDEKGRESHVCASRKEPFLGHQKGGSGKRAKEKVSSSLWDQRV
jgi:hypothetical protein